VVWKDATTPGPVVTIADGSIAEVTLG
jgi:hypothetical protein